MCNKKNRPVLNKYKAAIIGCGDIGFFYDHNNDEHGLTHFSTLEQAHDLQLLAISDTNADTRALIVREHNKRVYADFNEMMRQESPLDIVSVATPDETHEEILTALLQYRPRLVFAEKPLATSAAAMRKIINLYNDTGIGLQVNFYRRFTKTFQQVKDIIDSQEIGRIQAVTIYYSRGFYHNCCHFCDLINWYFGMPHRVYFESMKVGLSIHDPTRSLFLQYEDGLEIRLIGLEASQLLTYEIDMLATAGRIRLLHGGEMEVYHIGRNEIWPDFEQFKLFSKEQINFSGAMPAALKNIKGWLNGKEKLMSPAVNSMAIHEITAIAEEIN